jgi:hypothetical protein
MYAHLFFSWHTVQKHKMQLMRQKNINWTLVFSLDELLALYGGIDYASQWLNQQVISQGTAESILLGNGK